jgi:DNA-binding NtrC family response regulator
MKPMVLVSEEDSHQREATADILTEAGYSVLEAVDAAEAVMLVEENPTVAVLFTNVIIPGMKDFALADLAQRRWPALRVLLTTTLEKLRHVDRRPGLLSSIILLKPFSRQELITAVGATLAQPLPTKDAGENAPERPPSPWWEPKPAP